MDEYSKFNHDGVSHAYRIWGEGAATVVILHGLGTHGGQFETDAERIAAAGYRVIVPDLRGHGRSGVPDPLSAETMTVQRMADDVVALLDSLGVGQAHFIGNSMGGVVALDIIKRQPSRVQSLATFGTVFALHFPPFIPHLQYFVGKLMGVRKLSDMTAKSVSKNPQTQDFIREAFAALNLRMVLAVQKTLRSYDYRVVAADFAGPILILRADADKSINKYLPKTLKALEHKQNFKLIEVADAGHITNLDQPAKVVSALLSHIDSSPS